MPDGGTNTLEEDARVLAKMQMLRRASSPPRYFEGGLVPKDGDWVSWRSNGTRWMVSASDDIEDPVTALNRKEWHDDVIFEIRP